MKRPLILELFVFYTEFVALWVKDYFTLQAAQGEETGQGDSNMEELEEGQEPDFPHTELAKLDEMINRPRWVVPVLPKGELEVLLDASIDLCKRSQWD